MGEPVFQAQQESKLIPPSLRSDSKAERWIKQISQAPAIWKLTVPVSWHLLSLGYMNTLHIYVITKMTRCLQKSEWSNNPERSAVSLADVTNPCIYSSNPPSFPRQDKFCDFNFTGDKLERDRAGWHRSAHTDQSNPSPHFISTEKDNIQPSEQPREKTTWASPYQPGKPLLSKAWDHHTLWRGMGRVGRISYLWNWVWN